ncbi:hypothetical protein [Aquibium microcysteis]|uniref:hypothetical protein n=1 Tax=Aquibium microcysteis TaxID=675281 RepID=UPI00165D09AF|nr:hypothetical protein [Aquibium microcysteis]
MRFLQPGRAPAAAERPETVIEGEIAKPSATEAEARPDHALSERTDGQPRPSEGLRILLERIDTLTSRLSACEETIRRMEQNEATLVERHAAERRDLEERLRRQVERQVADLSADMEQRQKAFAGKQAKLLELLASELSKVRSIAEGAGRTQPAEPAAGRSEPQASRRRAREAGPELDFFEAEGAGARAQGAASRQDRTREDFEFWDWLESLPPEPGHKAADDFDLVDLDENDLK